MGSSNTSSKIVYTKLIDKYNAGEGKKLGIVDGDGNPVSPETWDDFRTDAKKLTTKLRNEYGVVPFLIGRGGMILL